MASDLTKVKLGPCKVTYDVGGTTPIVFETTKGGVVLTYEENTKEIIVDQFGDTAVGEYIIGRKASVQIPFAEYDLDKLVKIIPGSILTTSGTEPKKKRLDVDASKVVNLLDYAKKVKLEPLAEGATANDAVILYKAAPRANISYTYDYSNERVSNVTFKAFPESGTTGKLIGFGDESA